MKQKQQLNFQFLNYQDYDPFEIEYCIRNAFKEMVIITSKFHSTVDVDSKINIKCLYFEIEALVESNIDYLFLKRNVIIYFNIINNDDNDLLQKCIQQFHRYYQSHIDDYNRDELVRLKQEKNEIKYVCNK
jgi:hypothetical protein